MSSVVVLYVLTLSCYRTGLDLIKGVVRNNVEAGVIEPSMSKVKIIQVSSWLAPFVDVKFVSLHRIQKPAHSNDHWLSLTFCDSSSLHKFNWSFCTICTMNLALLKRTWDVCVHSKHLDLCCSIHQDFHSPMWFNLDSFTSVLFWKTFVFVVFCSLQQRQQLQFYELMIWSSCSRRRTRVGRIEALWSCRYSCQWRAHQSDIVHTLECTTHYMACGAIQWVEQMLPVWCQLFPKNKYKGEWWVVEQAWCNQVPPVTFNRLPQFWVHMMAAKVEHPSLVVAMGSIFLGSESDLKQLDQVTAPHVNHRQSTFHILGLVIHLCCFCRLQSVN
jgi:hypothetical protein